jgi:hypothetical protein
MMNDHRLQERPAWENGMLNTIIHDQNAFFCVGTRKKRLGLMFLLGALYSSVAWAVDSPGLCEAYPLTPFHQEMLAVPTRDTFPERCVEYGMKTTLDFLSKLPHQHFFGQCASPSGFPRPSAMPACLTPDYVKVTQHSMQIVTDCLDLPIKEILPKLKGESGFFHQALGRGYDAGMGQLTQGALIDARRYLPVIQQEVWRKSATHPSCQFLQKHWKALASLSSTSVNHRCELMSWPLNPLKNFLWFGSYFLWLKHLLHQEYIQYHIESKLPALSHSALEGILTNVAYNSGSDQIIRLLSDYLNRKHKQQSPVTKNDFNFKEDLSWINAVPYEQWRTIPIDLLSFPGYVKVYLKIGHPGYLSDLMKQIYHYNNALGDHLCTPEYIEGYLAL